MTPGTQDPLAGATAASEAVHRRLNAFLEDLYGREPRYRYFQRAGGPMFGWYVESPTEGERAGRYASFVYEPVGPGSRSGKATTWRYVPEAESWHDLRRDAKARALRLFREWEAGTARPWR